MHRIDSSGATPEQRFTEGNPTTGVPATVVTADWLNAVQEEIVAVLAAAGLELSKPSNTQLRDAIVALIAGAGVSPTAATVAIADVADYFTGASVEAALQQLGEKLYAGTLAANQIRRQVIALAGATHQSAVGHLENLVEVSHATATEYRVRADADMPAPIGSAIQVCAAGAGKVSIIAEAGVTILKPSTFNAATLGQHAIVVLVKRAANTWRLGGALEAA